MKLRTRMTFTHALASSLLFVAAFALLYAAMAGVLAARRRADVRLAVSQIAAVEDEQGQPLYEDEVPLPNGTIYRVCLTDDGRTLAAVGPTDALAHASSSAPERIRTPSGDYIALSSEPLRAGAYTFAVQAAVPCAADDRALALLRLILAASLPLLLCAETTASFLIAGRMLFPVHAIACAANRICADGDFSLRIPEPGARDELFDLTRTLNRMLAAQESALMRERRFTSDASHELRTPLSVIAAYTDNLLALNDPTQHRDALLVIRRECGRMQRLIGQMLSIARAQMGRMPLHPEALSLDALTEGVGSALGDALRSRNMTLGCQAEPSFTFTADQSLMTQLLLNLIENAVKYGKPGGHIVVTGRTECGAHILTVSDDGPGIAEADLPHIFERFYRADAVRDGSGAGLGLALAQEIALAHGGTLSASSAPGRGAAFTLTLPVFPR